MNTPVQVAFKDLPVSDAVEASARKHADALERFFDRIIGCRIVIAAPQRRGHKGNLYSVRVDLTVPGAEIIVNREHRFDHAHEDVYVAMRDAFDAATRRLEDYVRRMRGQVKSRVRPAGGHITKLFMEDGHGFLTTPDAREIYFHRNAIVAGDFARLRIGDQVWFEEELGESGPQATSIHLSHPHRPARIEPEAAT